MFIIGLIAFGCHDDESPKIDNPDILINSISDLNSLPEGLQSVLTSSNGRTLNNDIIEIKKIKFTDHEKNEKSIIGMQLEHQFENLNLTLYYDESSEGMAFLIEEVHLGDDIYQLNYLSPDGNYLFMQLEGPKENMNINFVASENGEPISLNINSNGRTSARCSWSGYFNNTGGCLERLWATRTFKIVATAALLSGNGGYVAAGAVLGCGIGEGVSCLRNWRTYENNNCTNVLSCGRVIPKNRLTKRTGTVSFQFANSPY